MVCSFSRSLARLGECYRDVLQRHCSNAQAGALMEGLIEQVFHDPAYLRMHYTPRCDVHRRQDTQQLVTPPTRRPNHVTGSWLSANSGSSLRHDRICMGMCCVFVSLICRLFWRHLEIS